MSSITNTTITSYDYLLRNCYSSNRNARRASTRTSYSDAELANADSQALRKVAKNLKDLSYSSDNGVNIYNNIKAFADTYNNLLSSSENVNSSKITREIRQLKNVLKEHKDDLEDLGITISSSGELKIKKTTLVGCSPSKVAKIFSGEKSTVMKDFLDHANRVVRFSKGVLNSGNSLQKKGSQSNGTQTAGIDPALANALMTSDSSVDFKA